MSDLNTESSNKKKGLGRGLGSLLGSNTSANAPATTLQSQMPTAANNVNTQVTNQTAVQAPPLNAESKIWQVAIEKLSPGAFQPRRIFTKESLQELAQSIKENGILQPITARRVSNGKLEIVAGERRWRASQLAGLTEVPVILKNFNDKEALELAIVENIQREDLNPLEEAEGYQRLIAEFKLSQQQVADKVGRDRATVANAVRLLILPTEVKQMIATKTLSVGHAKVLLSLNDPQKQIALAKKVIEEKVAVRKLEKLVHEELAGGKKEGKEEKSFDQNVTQRLIAGLSDELQKMLSTKVTIDYSQSKGKISIHFYSDDELTHIVDRLKEGCQK